MDRKIYDGWVEGISWFICVCVIVDFYVDFLVEFFVIVWIDEGLIVGVSVYVCV